MSLCSGLQHRDISRVANAWLAFILAGCLCLIPELKEL